TVNFLLGTSIRRKRTDLWKNNSWFLHHDNAPSHTAIVLREFFATTGTHIVLQPPYSPDLAPADFWLFNKLKRPLRGHRFDTIEEIEAAATAELKDIPASAFSTCLEEWEKRWKRCIASEGDYFECDDLHLA
uniref:Tc1-like transposase DDE domain-containing protein n=1 Tax=Anopheles atroparvus TaxID=41427 RepID=A0AAG5DU69_ANOAO